MLLSLTLVACANYGTITDPGVPKVATLSMSFAATLPTPKSVLMPPVRALSGTGRTLASDLPAGALFTPDFFSFYPNSNTGQTTATIAVRASVGASPAYLDLYEGTSPLDGANPIRFSGQDAYSQSITAVGSLPASITDMMFYFSRARLYRDENDNGQT